MADAITNRVVANTPDAYVIHLTNISDGTGETNAIKADKSTLTDTAGVEPVALDIFQVRWAIQGMTYVKFSWDHTTDDTSLVLANSGYDDFRGLAPQALQRLLSTKGLQDPLSTGDTGDVLLTTVGAVSGGTYDITLWLYKRPAAT